MGRRLKDLTEKRFGRLVVVSRGESAPGRSYWLCRCDCGTVKEIAASSLKAGFARSCGCLNSEVSSARNKIEKRTHGQSGTPLFIVWQTMKRRCYEKHNHAYPNYGGRGITVCDAWHEFEQFYKWAKASGYSRGLYIERVDNDGPYSPENCTWATPKEQARNRRNTIKITYKGETKPLTEWAEELGVSDSMLRQRVHNGWSPERTLTEGISS